MPFGLWRTAAAQLHQTGHSSIAQHFRKMKVGSADLAAVRCTCAIRMPRLHLLNWLRPTVGIALSSRAPARPHSSIGRALDCLGEPRR